MCGRYALFGPVKRSRAMLEDATGAGWITALWDAIDARAPRYNLAPLQMAPVVRQDEQNVAVSELRWGLLPSWARDPTIAQRTFNARRESAADTPMFRDAFRHRRCLVPASGYYEWQSAGEGKQPYYVHARDGGLLLFAGLWEHRHTSDDTPLETFTILTEDAVDPALRRIYPRMPVILAPALWNDWLRAPAALASALLVGKPDVALEAHPVSRDVGSPRHDEARLVAPLG